ncbi:glycosyl transferase family 1, partial [Sulfolobus sp. B1]
MKILAIGNVFNISGVSTHIINVLKELVKLGDEVTLYVPSFLVKNNYEVLKDLEKSGVRVFDSVYDVIEKYNDELKQGTFSYFLKSHTVYIKWNDLGIDRNY